MCTWHAGHREHLNPGPSTALSWRIKSWILSNALTCPYCPRWSCCTGTRAKTWCVTSDWSKAHRFLTNVTNQISIKYSRLLDFLIKRCGLAPLASPSPLSNMFSMRRGQAECKLREKHYTCLSEQAGGTAIGRSKKKGMDLRRVKVRTYRGQIQIMLGNIRSAITLEVSETGDFCNCLGCCLI